MSLPHLTYTAGSDATLSPAGLTQLLKHPATIPCIAVGAVSGVLAWHGSAMLWSIIGKRARHSPIPPRDRWAHDSLTTRPKRIGPSCCPILKCSTSGRIGPPTPPLDGRTNQQGEQGELGELPLWYHAWVIQRATTPKGVSWISKPWLEGLEAKGRWMVAVTEAERMLAQHRRDLESELELELDHQPGLSDRRTAGTPLQFFDRSFPSEVPGEGLFGAIDPTPTPGPARPRIHLATRVALWLRNMTNAASNLVTRDPGDQATGGHLSSPRASVSATLDLSSSLMRADQLAVDPECSWSFQIQSLAKGPSDQFQECEISLSQRYPRGESPWYYGCYGQTWKNGNRGEDVADTVLRRVLVKARREAGCGIIELGGETWRYEERESGVYVIVERLDWSPEDVDVESLDLGEAETEKDEDSDVDTADEILGWGLRKRAKMM